MFIDLFLKTQFKHPIINDIVRYGKVLKGLVY